MFRLIPGSLVPDPVRFTSRDLHDVLQVGLDLALIITLLTLSWHIWSRPHESGQD